jgi:hypothetical protein
MSGTPLGCVGDCRSAHSRLNASVLKIPTANEHEWTRIEFALITGEIGQSRQGRRRVAGRRKPPDQEPTPHTPAGLATKSTNAAKSRSSQPIIDRIRNSKFEIRNNTRPSPHAENLQRNCSVGRGRALCALGLGAACRAAQCPVASIINESQIENSKSERISKSKRKKTTRPPLQKIAARQRLAAIKAA